MRTVITRLSVVFLIVFALACSAFAQAPDPAVPPNNFIAVGAAYDGATGNGWASYGKSLGNGFYSFTTYDVTIASRKPLVFQHSTRTGIGFDVTTIIPSLSFGGRLHLFELLDAGAAATPNSIGLATSPLGGLGAFDLGARFRHVHLTGGGRVLKSTNGIGTVAEVGLMYPF